VQSKILQAQKNTLSVLATPLGDPEKTVNVSLFGGIHFDRVGTPQLTLTNDGLLEVASVDDLMSTKLKVIMQRVLDYRDIAALAQAGVDLPRGLAAA